MRAFQLFQHLTTGMKHMYAALTMFSPGGLMAVMPDIFSMFSGHGSDYNLSFSTRADASSQPNASSRPALWTLCQKRGVHYPTSRHREELGVPVGADVLERHAEEGVSWLVLRLLQATILETMNFYLVSHWTSKSVFLKMLGFHISVALIIAVAQWWRNIC